MRVNCDRTKMQMGLQYVAQNELEGTEVIWSEEENKGTLLLPSTASLEGMEKTKPCQRHIQGSMSRKTKIAIS